MRRGVDDALPPVEPWEAPADEPPAQRIEVGRRRRPRRARGAAAAIVLLGVLGVGLLIDDGGDAPTAPGAGDDEPRDNSAKLPPERDATTASPRASTTTTDPPPPVPILPGAGARVVLVSPSKAELLDLDTGIAVGLPVPDSAYNLVAVGDGVVYLDGDRAMHLALPADGPVGQPVPLGRAIEVHAAPAADAVWLIDPVPGSETEQLQATLVDVGGTVRAGPRDVSGGHVAGVHPAGLVVQAAGRIYLVGDDGSVQVLGTGEVLGVSQGWLLTRSCDDRLECGLTLRDPHLVPRPVPRATVASFGGWIVVDDAGRRAALLLYGSRGPEVAVLDLVSGELEEIQPMSGNVSGIAWLPGDLGLLIARPYELVRVHEREGEIRVDQLRYGGADSMVMLPG